MLAKMSNLNPKNHNQNPKNKSYKKNNDMSGTEIKAAAWPVRQAIQATRPQILVVVFVTNQRSRSCAR